MAFIHFITGGQRSGKSGYAQKLALEIAQNPVYLATAQIWDEDFRERVARHQADRGEEWTNLEIQEEIAAAQVEGRVVVLDCITLWLNNLFFKNQNATVDEVLQIAKTEIDKLAEKEATFFIISNEIGMGGHAENALARRFADLQGWMNQYIAQKADKVTLMVSGIAVSVKA